MSKSEENHITAVSLSFYKNVFLLTQMLPPSFEFRQHFKKGMFDKPNTTGFLHVSHYLSVIYDAKLFKQMVSWPVLCKKDEVTYRVEMKNFLSVLSRDNPDIKFPSILMSHLVHSGGNKFLIIMWKLSQLALRVYIKNEIQGELLNAPCTSLVDNLTVTYFNNIIAEKCNVAAETHKETQRILDNANNFLNNEIETLKRCKSEIFDRKENIDRLILNVSTYPLIQKRLTNVEDLDIINFWKKNILEEIQNVREKNKELNELEESCKRLWELNLRVNSNSSILDANKFPRINCDNRSSCMRSETQHLFHNLYVNGSVVFSTLLSLLYLTFTQILNWIPINIANFSDLSPCLIFIHNSFKNMKSLETLFIALNTRITSIYRDEQRVSEKVGKVHINFKESTLIANHDVSVQSFKINFNFNQYVDDYMFYKELCPSPKEDKYKHLFTRYKRKYCPSYELSAAPLDFSSSWHSMNKSSPVRTHSTKCEQVSFNGKPLSPVYSRLLDCSKLNQKHSRGNVLCNLNYEGLNIISRKRHKTLEHSTPDNNSKRRNIFK